MKSLLHSLVALLVAVWLAIPSSGSEGGENAGGTGVWVLPFSANISSECESGPQASQPRLTIAVQDLNRDVRLVSSAEVGQIVATCIDDQLGIPVLLPVVGRCVTVPSSLLRTFSQARVDADIVIVDAEHNGYLVAIRVAPATGAVQLLVY